jgi:hypothetical protein
MKTDMSSDAITRRLKAASELRDLCLKLGEARPLTVEEEPTPYRTKMSKNEEQKKKSECAYLNAFLNILHRDVFTLEQGRERPDFILTDNQHQKIGCDVTEYHTNSFPQTANRRAIESGWGKLRKELRQYSKENPKARGGFLVFKNNPNSFSKETNAFTKQITECVSKNTTNEVDDLSNYPLLDQYLRKIVIRPADSSILWDSNLTAGWFGLDKDSLLDLLQKKSKECEKYEPCDEYWLLIVSGENISQSTETDIGQSLQHMADADQILKASKFGRAFFFQFTHDQIFEWANWQRISKGREIK